MPFFFIALAYYYVFLGMVPYHTKATTTHEVRRRRNRDSARGIRHVKGFGLTLSLGIAEIFMTCSVLLT